MMKYSKEQTIHLATLLNKTTCLQDINQLIVKEGCTEEIFFIHQEELLDMDCVENQLAKEGQRNRFKSMDSALVVVQESDATHKIILVEFRFNYQNMKNLTKVELFEKVAGSTNALENTLIIEDKYYFIFKADLKQQAINRLYRMNPRPNNFIATDIHELKTLFFD